MGDRSISKAYIGKSGGDHLGATIVAVLAHLADQHAGPAALRLLKFIDPANNALPGFVVLVETAIDALRCFGFSGIPTVDRFQRTPTPRRR